LPEACTRLPYSGNTNAFVASLQLKNLPDAFAKTTPVNLATGIPVNPELSWATSAEADRYEYCYDTSHDNGCTAWVNNGKATSVTLSGLNLNTTYYWHVRSINSVGTTYSDGSDTASWSFTTGSLPWAFVKTAPADGATSESISPTLSWASSDGATRYEYCYASTDDNPCAVWVDNSQNTSVSLSSLAPSTTYYWHVRSINKYGATYSDGSDTGMWSFSTGDAPGAFVKITPINGIINQSINPTLSWGPSCSATRYEYCYDTTDDHTCSPWVDVGPLTSVPLSGLSPKTTYYWHVRAINNFGVTYAGGGPSAFSSFTTFLKKLFFPLISRR
jgi:hypothetical protein